MDDFASWLQASWKRSFGSQTEAAVAMGTTDKTLRTWVRGEVLPQPMQALGIAAGLREPVADVLDRLLAAHRAAVLAEAEVMSRQEAAEQGALRSLSRVRRPPPRA